MRRLLKLTVIILGLMLLAVWSPWQNWNYHWTNLFGIESREQFSGLKLKSFAGDLELFLDGESVGVVGDQESFLEIFPVNPGEHTIKIARPEGNGFYTAFERTLNFEKEVDVVIGYDLGPSLLFSEGHVLTAKKSYTKGQNPTLDIISIVEDVDVKIDGVDVGKTPLRSIPMSIESTHVLNFSKRGFDPLEIEIFPTDQSERDKLRDIVLTLEVNLFAKPVELTAQR